MVEQRQRKPWTYWLIWVALVAVYLAAPLAHLSDYAWNYDEGPQIQAAALAQAGYPLYSEVALNKPPLLTWLLQLAFRLGGATVPTARLAVLVITTGGFLALGLLAEQWWGRWAGPATMAIFLALPEVPVRAAVVMNDMPAMAAILVALTAAFYFCRTAQRLWLAVSAVAYTAVLSFHPFLFPLIIPIMITLLIHHPPGARLRGRIRWRDMVYFGTIVAGLTVVWVLAVDRRGLVHWVLEYNTAPIVYEWLVPHRTAWKLITQHLSRHWVLTGLAVAGGIILPFTPERRPWMGVVAVWFLIILTLFVLWRWPWKHYALFLSYPLAIVAGGGVAAAIRRLTEQQAATYRGKCWRDILAILILIGALLFAAERVTTPLEWSHWTAEQRAAQSFLKQEGTPGKFIISDDQFLAFTAGYLVPPSLADTSWKRIRTGFLQVSDIIGQVLEHHVRFILFRTERFAVVPSLEQWTEQFAVEPSLEQWTELVASQRYDFDSIRIYRVDFFPPSDLLDFSLGESIHLCGYRLSQQDRLRAGETLTVTLYWESATPPQEDFTIFVHLVDADDHLVGQHDGPPLLRYYPTSRWIPNVMVPDPHPIALNNNLPPGTYRLLVGMYRWPSLERLPAFLADGSRWPYDRILLTELHLTAP